jgi:hypothetical protein
MLSFTKKPHLRPLIACPDSDRAVNDVGSNLTDEILHCKGGEGS